MLKDDFSNMLENKTVQRHRIKKKVRIIICVYQEHGLKKKERRLLLQSTNWTTWPGGTPKPSPTAHPSNTNDSETKTFIPSSILNVNPKNTAELRCNTVWHIQKVMALPGNQNDN